MLNKKDKHEKLALMVLQITNGAISAKKATSGMKMSVIFSERWQIYQMF